MNSISDYRRALLAASLAGAVACALAIAVVDGPLAMALRTLPAGDRRAIQDGVGVLEMLFAFAVSPYLYGGLLVLGGLAAFRTARNPLVPRTLLFVGLSHLTSRFVADILKPPFSRLRPYEALGTDGWQDVWLAPVGNSFPSGHAVHFWGLFFPLAVLFPRWTVPLAALPVAVSAARVAVNDHYLGDVLGSAALAALVTWAYAIALLDRTPEQTGAERE